MSRNLQLITWQEKDPEFYKFLVEEDQQLLDFTADAVDAGSEGGEEEEAVEEDQEDDEVDGAFVQEQSVSTSSAAARQLTLERFKQIELSAPKAFTAFKAALNAYHTAVRSIDPDVEAKDGDEEAPARRRAPKRKRSRGSLTIEDEATFSEVLEWCLGNALGLLKHYAGEELQASKGKKKKVQKDEAGNGYFDPTCLAKWKRVKVLCNIFWDETLILLNKGLTVEMQEAVLRTCSSQQALCWLWPCQHLRRRFLRRCCAIWARPASGGSEASPGGVRLLSFLFLRNAAAMLLLKPGSTKDIRGIPTLEALIRTVLRSFASAAAGTYTWRSVSNFRFMENCILELFRLDDATSYRVGYVWIRQLALLLRNASMASSKGGSINAQTAKTAKAKAKAKAAKGRAKRDKAAKGKAGKEKMGKCEAEEEEAPRRKVKTKPLEELMSWQFVRSMYLWTRVVTSVPSLKPLAYPLFMVILGAVKSRLTNLQCFPFVCHGLTCLNRLAAGLEVLVPLSSHLLKLLDIVHHQLESRKKFGSKAEDPDGEEAEAGERKPPDMEVLLRLSTGREEVLVMVAERICGLFIDHLGLLSRSTSFPELSAPVVLHLRRQSKHCRNETLRKQLKALLAVVEQSSQEVQRYREQLQEPPPAGKLLVLAADATPLAKQRAQWLKRRAENERSKVEGELEQSKARKRRKVAKVAKG
ncbi:Noc2l [Symbiodinium natans]|uniref:Noc2l protein n=1 Tax=Symbiodinium natans TaxID=878477 RepID=A0A812PD16_9DINO|nr:Noc2l [Symbiodinium natans]